jgi:hypothetical protein
MLQLQRPAARESIARQRSFEAGFRINVPANFASVWDAVSLRMADLLIAAPRFREVGILRGSTV